MAPLSLFEMQSQIVRIQTIGIENLLTVDIHFNSGKNWVPNDVYLSHKKNWSLLFLLSRRRFLIRFCLFSLLFLNFFGFVGFVTTTFVKFQFRSQVNPSHINVVVPIALKLKLYATFSERGIKINFFFVGRQIIVNYWDFASKHSRNCHWRLVLKIARQDCWRMFVKNMSSRPTGLFWRFGCYHSACSPFCATITQLIYQSLSSYTLCSRLFTT